MTTLRFAPLLAAALLASCAGAKLEKQRKEIEDLQTRAGTLVSELKTSADEIEALKASKAELEARIVELEGRSAAAEGRITTLSKSNKDLASSLGASKDALGEKLNAALAEKDELARKLSDAVKEKLAVERLKTIYQNAKDRAAKDLDRIKAERERLAAGLAGADAEKRRAAEERAKLEAERSAALLKAREEMGGVADAVLKELQAGTARLEQAGEGFALSLSDSALFDDGSAKIHDKGAALLGRVGPALKALPARAWRVEGHTDNAPFKKGLLGGFAGHWELSSARATAVARWLHEHAGLDPAKLSAAGHGEFRPVKPNDTPENRAANRRISIVTP